MDNQNPLFGSQYQAADGLPDATEPVDEYGRPLPPDQQPAPQPQPTPAAPYSPSDQSEPNDLFAQLDQPDPGQQPVGPAQPYQPAPAGQQPYGIFSQPPSPDPQQAVADAYAAQPDPTQAQPPADYFSQFSQPAQPPDVQTAAYVPQPASDQPMTADPGVPPPSVTGSIYTGLSGNELYCMNLIGYRPGNLLVGNSVYAIGFLGSFMSNIRTTIGGEIQQFTNMISEGRRLALQRLDQELANVNGQGATGVTSELVFHPGNIEFLSIGSAIHRIDGQNTQPVTSAADGQEFYCEQDAGYSPVKFVFGNVAYSLGIGRNFLGELKEMVKGEVKQYTNIFNITRNLALQRISDEAKAAGANSVIGIRTTILPIVQQENNVQEMVMVGTASINQQVASIADAVGGVITSDLTSEETWNVARLGYVPMKLILGTSVYSLGIVGGIRAALRGYVKGEISTLTQMIYGAREQSLKKVQEQAQAIGADEVLGIKTYIYQLAGGSDVIEFLAIGTAVKKVPGVTTHTDQLPPQAIIRDKTTFVNVAQQAYDTNLNMSSVEHPGPTAPPFPQNKHGV